MKVTVSYHGSAERLADKQCPSCLSETTSTQNVTRLVRNSQRFREIGSRISLVTCSLN